MQMNTVDEEKMETLTLEVGGEIDVWSWSILKSGCGRGEFGAYGFNK